jgi:hypothetical protein
MGETFSTNESYNKFISENLEGKDRLGDIGMDGTITLKRM